MHELVSIIVPVYNVEKYIHRCIESILKQDYVNFELIVVDDGSLDSSIKIVEKFSHDHRLTIITQENKGVSSARNTGLANATGKYCCFIDSDDYVEPNYISKLQNTFTCHDTDFVCCGVFVSEKLDGSFASILKPKEDTLLDQKQAIKTLFSEKTFSGWPYNKMYDINIIRNNNLTFDENIRYCEDEIFVLSYLMHCKNIIFIKDVLYHYMYNESSVNNKMVCIDQKFNYASLDRLKADDITYAMIRSLNDNEITNTAKARYFCSNLITISKFFIGGYNKDKVTLKILTKRLRKFYLYYITSKEHKVGLKRILTLLLLIVSPRLYFKLK